MSNAVFDLPPDILVQSDSAAIDIADTPGRATNMPMINFSNCNGKTTLSFGDKKYKYDRLLSADEQRVIFEDLVWSYIFSRKTRG